MADITNLSSFLGDVANSIRAKKGTTEPISASNFDTEIAAIPTGTLVEKVTIDASKITEGDTTVTIDSAPVGEPVVLPESGIAEVVADKAVLAESVGVTPDKIIKGSTVLGVEGAAETATELAVTSYEYGLNMFPVEMTVAADGIGDVSPDGKYYAKASGKTITFYQIKDGTPVSMSSQLFSVTYDFSSCRFANAYDEVDGCKVINVYAASCGHDSDAVHLCCMRVKFLEEGGIYITAITSANMTGSWEGNATSIYPHPTEPNIVFLNACGRDSYGIRLKLLQISDSAITLKYSFKKAAASQSDFSASYDCSWGQWGDNNTFYIQDNTLNLTYKVAIGITDGILSSATMTQLSGYAKGNKSFTTNYCLINKSLYPVTGGSESLTTFLGPSMGDINLIFENEDGLFLYTMQAYQQTLYRVDTDNNYNLEVIRSYIGSGILSPFNTSGTHIVFDKVRITNRKSGPGRILVMAGDIINEPISVEYDGVTYYNMDDTTAAPGDIKVGRVARNLYGKVQGTMANYKQAYVPGQSKITIPTGFHSGSTIEAVDITTMEDYITCNNLCDVILSGQETIDDPYITIVNNFDITESNNVSVQDGALVIE